MKRRDAKGVRSTLHEKPRTRLSSDAREFETARFDVHEEERPRLYDASGYSVQRAVGCVFRFVRRTDD